MLSAGLRCFRVMPSLLLILVGAGFAQMKPGDRRNAYGEVRASITESVLTVLYPGAQVLWEPDLMIKMPGDRPRMVQVPVYVRGSAATGGLEGAASVELEGEKEKFIFDTQGFQRSDSPAFSTVLVVFRADTSGHIEKYKKFMLDPREPLTEIKTLSMQDWSQKEWPNLEIQYNTHLVARDSFTTIEWHGVFDANSGQFINRLPFVITHKVNGGPEESYAFSIRRSSPTTLLIADHLGGSTHSYNCADPCVIEARTLLSQWIK